ncbi:MAG TPA: hypothetical protein VJ246_00010 [Patescibacteria group bacterium]|nr:hypothetical protein [Patescibacteria group bacterium]
MTINVETRVGGAEYIETSCHTCPSRLGGLLISSEHNGYGEHATPFSIEELSQAYANALAHDLIHGGEGDIVMHIFRAQDDSEELDLNLLMSLAATMRPESKFHKFLRGVGKKLTRKERKQQKKEAKARRRAGL